MVVAFLVIGMVSAGYGYELEADVKRFLDNYVKDSTAKWGPLEYKRRGIIPDSIQIKELRLRALQVYCVKYGISFDKHPDTIAFSEIIGPTNRWRVLVMAHNKPLYELLLEKKDGKLEFGGASFPSPGSSYRNLMWISLLESYPESTGINPVFVTTELLPETGFHRGDRFLYFPQKGPRSVHYIKRGYAQKTDTLATLFTGSIENLDDSRKYVEYRKKQKPSPKIPKPEDIKQRELLRKQATENREQK